RGQALSPRVRSSAVLRTAETGGVVLASRSRATADNDVAVRALDNRSNLGLLRGGNLELVESLLQVVEEGVPLWWRDLEITVGIDHGAPGILLRASGSPAQHFGYQVLEAGRRKLMMRFVDEGVGVESRIAHDAINQGVDDA